MSGGYDKEKKKHACQFVDVDTSKLWETLPEFSDAAKTFKEFVKAVHTLYPGSKEECKWLVANIDKLVGESDRDLELSRLVI
jgi:hypothetical protein